MTLFGENLTKQFWGVSIHSSQQGLTQLWHFICQYY